MRETDMHLAAIKNITKRLETILPTINKDNTPFVLSIVDSLIAEATALKKACRDLTK